MTRICVFIIAILFIFITSVFVTADSWVLSPAFDDQVSGKTSLINMQSLTMESKLKIRAISGDGAPAGVEYMVSIAPVNGTDAAIGTVMTDFKGFILEGSGTAENESARNEWRDRSMVSGAIVNFMKSFTYTSGIKL
ncbi:hypothetical protein [Methanospirillum sp.]|uniref:hypothetical protein n=1 Tax=Methanospirillum sp. TaxID=45200 RepID=UPI002984DB9B|nr:hypothetical protein [Methanospirillum sp.]